MNTKSQYSVKFLKTKSKNEKVNYKILTKFTKKITKLLKSQDNYVKYRRMIILDIKCHCWTKMQITKAAPVRKNKACSCSMCPSIP